MATPALTREEAETIALKALSFLTDEPALLARFMSTTGLSVRDVRARISDPALLGAVLDVILSEPAALAAFTAATEVTAERVRLARVRLLGLRIDG